jgi:molecular chaperone DnaK
MNGETLSRGPALFAIDFGTQHCRLAALGADGRPHFFATRSGERVIPSAVAFGGAAGVPSWSAAQVGAQARRLIAAAPRSGVLGIKRFLGRRYDDPEVRRLAPLANVVPAPNGDAWIEIAARAFPPPELAAPILAALRKAAEDHAGGAEVEAVLTVPASFDHAARQALKDAAALAGLKVARLLAEPTAAALGCGVQRRPRTRLAVCDFGAGRFDVSVLAVEPGIIEVLATAGERVGGDDFDRRIAARISGEPRGDDAVVELRHLDEAQRIKHAAMAEGHASFAVSGELPGAGYVRTVKRQDIDAWTRDLVDKLDEPCREALAGARLRPHEIREVLIVGGGSHVPAALRKIEQVFGCAPTRPPNPEDVVALGAAQYTATLAGAADSVLALDASARGLGFRVAGGRVATVIARGTPLPAHAERVLTTARDGQRDLGIDVFEGDAGDVGGPRHVGRYIVGGLPEAPAGEALVLVDFRIDGDGIITVGARPLGAAQPVAVRVVAASGLTRAEVRRHSPL